MCTSPILIKNKKFSRLIAPIYGRIVSVPCGVCDECLNKRSNDIYIRSRIEYLECLKHGGIGFMCCLTYDNDNLPTHDFLGKSYMVFDKKSVILFIKRLRVNLDRYYKRLYGVSAPGFKYLITSEFGSDPNRTHRPHYHLLFFFKDFISHYVFRTCFTDSKFVDGKAVFGKIQQCDVIDPKKGGIHYSCKYVLKDQSYDCQNQFINQYIKFYKDYVNQMFGINFSPKNEEEIFRNKCIRSTKAYKSAVEKYVLPYRHMLQFYMCSNDLGVSSIIERYGDSLYSLHSINFDGFEYSVPKIVKKRILETKGDSKAAELTKSCFLDYVKQAFNYLDMHSLICEQEKRDLLCFANKYLLPKYGYIDFVHTFDPYENLSDLGMHDWDDFIKDSTFYADNDFYVMRSRFVHFMNLYSSYSQDFRQKFAYDMRVKKEYEYFKRKKVI